MKHFIFIFYLLLASTIAIAQQSDADAAQLRQQIAKIRSATNWNDPAAVKKANEEIQKLSKQLNGGKQTISIDDLNLNNDQKEAAKSVNYEVKSSVTQENIVAIADRFFKRSYKVLDAMSKFQFDQDLKAAEKKKFSPKAVKNLASTGATLITFGNDHNVACVYLAMAVKELPADTLSVNNFGAYLRIIDSTKISVPVLLYANKLFSGSPVILTQLGNSYFELGDFVKAESYYKEAQKINPNFGPAHTSLCDLYISQKRLKEAMVELFKGVKGMGYPSAADKYASLKQAINDNAGSEGQEDASGGMPVDELKDAVQPFTYDVTEFGHVKMPAFPDCHSVEDWTIGGGYASAAMSYGKFMNAYMAFVGRMVAAHQEQDPIPEGAIRRNYEQERFMIDSMIDLFKIISDREVKKYKKTIDKITQQAYDANQLYLKNLQAYTKDLISCAKACPAPPAGDICNKNCEREFCVKNCPNSNQYNDMDKSAYNAYRSAFSGLVSRQIQNLKDFYAFTQPWADKIESGYWSKIYEFERKSLALGIVGSCYGSYPVAFLPPVSGCAGDCSIYSKPFVADINEVDTKDPKGKECEVDSKWVIHLFCCDASLTCEYFEVGCTEGASVSVRRNFGKNKSVSIFAGAGVEAGLGLAGASAKFGGVVVFGDEGSIDGGFRGSVSSTFQVPGPDETQVHLPGPNGYNGAESEFNLMVMGGLETEKTKNSVVGGGK